MKPLGVLLALALLGVCLGGERQRTATLQGNEPTYQGKTLSQWAALTKDQDERCRASAVAALGEMGPAAIPALVGLFRDDNGITRLHACMALGSMGPAALPTLTRLLGDKEATVRDSAATGIGLMGAKAKPAVGALTELLRDKDAEVRRSAVAALGCIGPDAKAATASLVEVLRAKHGKSPLAWDAYKALVKIGPAATASLAKLLRDKDAFVRRAAANALAQVDPEAMGPMGPEAKAAVPALVEMLRHGDLLLRMDAVKALRNMGPEAKAAIPALLDLLHDKDAEVGLTTVSALMDIPGAMNDVSVITGILQAPNPWTYPVRLGVAKRLWAMGPQAKAAIPALKTLLQDKDGSIRLPAAFALAGMGPDEQKAGLAVLTKLLQDKEAAVRREAAVALGIVGPEAQAAIPSLTRTRRDGHHDVREAAAAALEKIQKRQ